MKRIFSFGLSLLAGLIFFSQVPAADAAANVAKRLGSLDTPGYANDVAVVGNYAYVADGSAGLQIINISNPAAPVLTGSYNTPGSALRVVMVGSLAYVADDTGGLVIVNVSNPAAPTLTGTYDYDTFTAYAVAVAGNYAYVLGTDPDTVNGIDIVDISNPAAPAYLDTWITNANSDLAISGDQLFYALENDFVDSHNQNIPSVVAAGPGIGTVDISDLNDTNLDSYTLDFDHAYSLHLRESGAQYQSVFTDGTYVYTTDSATGLRVWIKKPTSVSKVPFSTFTAKGGLGSGIDIEGNYAIVSSDSRGIFFIDLRGPARTTVDAYGVNHPAPELVEVFDTPGTARRLMTVGRTLYVADWDSGLQVVDWSQVGKVVVTDIPMTNGYYRTPAGNRIWPFGRGFTGAIYAKKYDFGRVIGARYVFINRDAFSQTSIRVYDQNRRLMQIVKPYGTYTTAGLNATTAYVPAYGRWLLAVGTRSGGTSAKGFFVTSLGVTKPNAYVYFPVTGNTQKGNVLVKFVSVYPGNPSLITMLSGQRSTLKLHKIIDKYGYYQVDSKFDLGRISVSGEKIIVR